MTGFTPEEWRTAARVARRSIFTEGNPDLADAWEKAADQVEARFTPAGGMALTAEQVEDVRTVANCALQYGNIASREAASRLDSSLPVTEPVEERCPTCNDSGDVHRMDGEWLGVCDCPAGTPFRTPAEPAEEETKAHCMCVTPDWYHDGLDSDIGGRLCRRCRLRQNVPYRDLASSPVVPAPTETGPWQTWQEVPEGVKYSPKARPPAGSPLRLLAQPLWVNRGGTRHQARSGTVSKIGDVEMFHYAPFVAAKEG